MSESKSFFLKVHVPDLNLTKGIKVQSDALVSEIKATLLVSFATKGNNRDLTSYSLMKPVDENDYDTGFWLDPTKVIESYYPKDDMLLLFVPTVRTLRIKIKDTMTKTYKVDFSVPVVEILKQIGNDQNISRYLEYDFCLDPNEYAYESSSVMQESSTVPGSASTVARYKKTLKEYKTVKQPVKSATNSRIKSTFDKIEESNRKKTDKLKKNLLTEDKFLWLSRSETLVEQGVSSSDCIYFKRRYFFDLSGTGGDEKSDSILFEEAKEAILSGKVFCGENDMLQLIAYHLQIERGNIDDKFVDSPLMSDYMPDAFYKAYNKKHKTTIKTLWIKTFDIDPNECRCLYYKMVHKLPGYGTISFLCDYIDTTEKKLVKRVLMFFKDRVEVRMFPNLDKLEFCWSLDIIKSWAETDKQFRLCVQGKNFSYATNQGSSMRTTLASYLSMILEERNMRAEQNISQSPAVALVKDEEVVLKRAVGKFLTGKNGDGGVRIGRLNRSGEATRFGRGNISELNPQGNKYGSTGQHARTARSGLHVSAKKTFVQSLGDANTAIKVMYGDIEEDSGKYSNLQHDSLHEVDEYAQRVTQEKLALERFVSATNMASASCSMYNVVPSDTKRIDYNTLLSHLLMVPASASKLKENVKHYALLNDNNADNRFIYKDLIDYLKSLQGIMQEMEKESTNPEKYSTAISSDLSSLCKNASSLLIDMKVLENSEFNLISKDFADMLVELKNLVGSIVSCTKNIASSCESEDMIQAITADSTRFTTSIAKHILLCRMHLATKSNNTCYKQVENSTREAMQALQDLLYSLNKVSTDTTKPEQAEILKLKAALQDTMADILKFYTPCYGNKAITTRVQKYYEETIEGCDKFESHTETSKKLDDSKDICTSAGKLIAELYPFTCNSIKSQQCFDDVAEQHQNFEDKTQALQNLIEKCESEGVNNYQTTPEFKTLKDEMVNAEKNFRSILELDVKIILQEMEAARVKQLIARAIGSAYQMDKAVELSTPFSKNPHIHSNLEQELKRLLANIPELSRIMNETSKQNDSALLRYDLMKSLLDYSTCGSELVTQSTEAVQLIPDAATNYLLKSSQTEMEETLTDINSYLQEMQTEKSDKLKICKELVDIMSKDINSAISSHKKHQLIPLQDTNTEKSSKEIAASCNKLSYTIVQLNNNVNKNVVPSITDDLLTISRDLQTTFVSSRVVASYETEEEHDMMANMLAALKNLIESLGTSVKCAIKSYSKSENAAAVDIKSKEDMLKSISGISSSLLKYIGSVPGQKDLENLLKELQRIMSSLNNRETDGSKSDLSLDEIEYAELKLQLRDCIDALNKNIGVLVDVVSSSGSEGQIKSISEKIRHGLQEVSALSMKILSQMKSPEERRQFIEEINSAFAATSNLITFAKVVCADPSNVNKQQLINASRLFADAFSNALSSVVSLNPVHQSCESAGQKLELVRNQYLKNPNYHILLNIDYDTCLAEIKKKGKSIQMTTKDLSQKRFDRFIKALHCADTNKQSAAQIQKIVSDVHTIEESLEGMICNTAHACYLIAQSDHRTKQGREGLFDQNLISKARQNFQLSTTKLNKSQKFVEADMKQQHSIASKSVDAIIAECKRVVNVLKTSKPSYINTSLAEMLTDELNRLEKLISDKNKEYSDACKPHISQPTSASQKKMSEKCKALEEIMDKFFETASRSDLVSLPCEPSENSASQQRTIVAAQNKVVDSVCSLLNSYLEVAGECQKADANVPSENIVQKALESKIQKLDENYAKYFSILEAALADATPGCKEIESCYERLNSQMREVEYATLCSLAGCLENAGGRSKEFQEKIFVSLSATTAEGKKMLVSAQESNSEQKCSDSAMLENMTTKMELLSEATVGFSSIIPVASNEKVSFSTTKKYTDRRESQQRMLDEQRILLESLMNVVNSQRKNPATVVNGVPARKYTESCKQITTHLDQMEKIRVEVSQNHGLVYYIESIIDSVMEALDKPNVAMNKLQASGAFSLLSSDKESTEIINKIIDRAEVTPKEMMDQINLMCETVNSLITAVGSDTSSLGIEGKKIAIRYLLFASQLCSAISKDKELHTTPDVKLITIRDQMKSLGDILKTMLDKIGTVISDDSDMEAKRSLFDLLTKFVDKATLTKSTMQSFTAGENVIGLALDETNATMEDLSNTFLFAQLMTLEKDPSLDSRDAMKELITHQGMTKQLAEKIRLETQELLTGLSVESFKSGEAFDQKQISNIVSSLSVGYGACCERMKRSAVLLGTSENLSQLILLNASIDLSEKYRNLLKALMSLPSTDQNGSEKIDFTKVPKEFGDFQSGLQAAAKELKSATVSSIDEAFTALTDPSMRSKKALKVAETILKNSAETIFAQDNTKSVHSSKTIRTKSNDDSVKPENIVQLASTVNVSASKIISAIESGSRDEIIESSNFSTKSSLELIEALKELSMNEKTNPNLKALQNSVQKFILNLADLLSHSNSNLSTNKSPTKIDFKQYEEKFSESFSQIVADATAVKGSELTELESADSAAERELLAAAAAIKVAADKLKMLKIESTDGSSDDNAQDKTESQRFVVEGAGRLMKLTSELMTNAIELQKEVVKTRSKGTVESHKLAKSYTQDSRFWAQGLVVSSRAVSDSISVLCEVIHETVSGKGSEARMTAAIRAVSATVAQLVSACNIGTNTNCKAQPELVRLGKEVGKSSAMMLDTMKKEGMFGEKTKIYIKVDESRVARTKQHLDLKANVNKCEKELTEARQKLFRLRQKKYASMSRSRNQK